MADVTRRDAVKLAAGVTAGVLAAGGAVAREPKKVADPSPPADSLLEQVGDSLLGLMFHEQATSRIKGGGLGHSLYVTSALRPDGTPTQVAVRSDTAAVFRADPSRDEFTKQGGFYWERGDERGKVRFKTRSGLDGDRGPLVLAVRESDGTVRWYSLMPDFRC